MHCWTKITAECLLNCRQLCVSQQSCSTTKICDMPQTELCMHIVNHWDDACWCTVFHHAAANYCLCCITEGTKLLLDLNTCLHEKMLGYKLTAFSKKLQYKPGKTHCHISECSWMRIWGFLSYSITVALIFMKKYQAAEKSGTVLAEWMSQISLQKAPYLPDN